MKILFFPSDLGGGFGHISRCLGLARSARERHHVCAFGLNDLKFVSNVGTEFEVFRPRAKYFSIPIRRLLKFFLQTQKAGRTNVFTEISGLNYQVIRDGLQDPKTVEKTVARYQGEMAVFSPDVVVSDTNLLAGVAARAAGIPVVQLVRYASYPKTAGFRWWQDRPPDMQAPRIQPLFNPVLNKLGLDPLREAGELLTGDAYIVPSIPEIEPIQDGNNTFHVGNLQSGPEEESSPEWMKSLNAHKPLIYISIGGGAGLVGNSRFFDTTIRALEDQDVQVIVSTGLRTGFSRQRKEPSHIRFFPWVPGRAMIKNADLVIFHGGYGTMMEVLSAGKPSLVIPFHTEQEGNGRRLEKLGCGKVLKLSRQEYIPVECRWGYGSYEYLIQDRYDLSPEELSREIDELLTNRRFAINARNIKTRLEQYGGATSAVDRIERLTANQRQ